MKIKYNEFGEVVSVNGLATGQHLGTPLQDALGTPEENSPYYEERCTVTKCYNTCDDAQPAPSGGNIEALEITENGTYTAEGDVTGYSPVTVNVPVPEGYIVPSGTLYVGENGTHDATEYSSVTVAVPPPDDPLFTMYCEGNLTEINNDSVTRISNSAFSSNSYITKLNLPSVTFIGEYGFSHCRNLSEVNIPNVTALKNQALYRCPLSKLDLHRAVTIYSDALNGTNLTTLILRSTSYSTLDSSGAINGTPISKGTGYIYVPSTMIEYYKVRQNWKYHAAQFRALEDYTVDGTITGELDETKI